MRTDGIVTPYEVIRCTVLRTERKEYDATRP
jgi:hypothetical protein